MSNKTKPEQIEITGTKANIVDIIETDIIVA